MDVEVMEHNGMAQCFGHPAVCLACVIVLSSNFKSHYKNNILNSFIQYTTEEQSDHFDMNTRGRTVIDSRRWQHTTQKCSTILC